MADLNIGNSTANVIVNAKHNGSVTPQINNTYDLGTSALRWKNIYGGTFVGSLSGNATTATNANKLTTSGHLDTVEKLDAFIESNRLKFATVANIGGVASDGMIISVPWNDSSWGHQVFLDDSAMVMQHRHRYTKTNSDGSTAQAWSGWATLLDSNNYNSYAPSKTGTGASGTWGININGNAATATKLATERTISLTGSVTGSGTFDGSGNLSIATTTNHTHATATTSANGFMSSDDKAKLDGIATGANKYIHPTYTAKSAGFYKVTVDGTGHVSATMAVTKADITGLGIPGSDTWRGVQNNLTSTSTTDSLSAAQGKILNETKAVNKTLTNEDLNTVTIPGFYNAGGGNSVINKPSGVNHFGLIVVHNASGTYYTQNIFNDSGEWKRTCTNGTWGSWTNVTVQTAVPANAKFTDTVYTHPMTSGNKHIPSGGSAGQILRWSADGTAAWGADNNTTYSANTGIKLNGTTFQHTNSVTAATAQGDANKTLTFGGTFTIPTVTYDAQGHITGKGTTTMTMPANPNTDTKVTQTVTTSDAAYPLLLAPNGQTDTTTTTSYFDSGVTLNPSTNTIAANISGNAATATNADKLDNLHAGDFVRAYNTTSDNIDADWGQSFKTFDPIPSGTPPEQTPNISLLSIGNDWIRRKMFAFMYDSDNIYYRRKINNNFTAWVKLLHSGNYNSYAPTLTGGGASGTWNISINGGAKYLNSYGNTSQETGRTSARGGVYTYNMYNETANGAPENYLSVIGFGMGTNGHVEIAGHWCSNTGLWYRSLRDWEDSWYPWNRIWVAGNSVTSAVWNDYAEYREADTIQGGRCVREVGDDTLTLTTTRLMRGCSITSDTWGFAQGETDKAKTPIAVAGRVLAYPLEDRELFKEHIGYSVCSGPDGTVSLMTEEEELKYPWAIVGTVSAVPDYEEWGGGEMADRPSVKIDGRIWIKVK